MTGFLTNVMTSPLTFDITKFGTNLYNKLREWGNILVIIIGVVMMIVAVWQIAKGLIQHGKAQVSWAVAIALLIIGGALASFGTAGVANPDGAWKWLEGIAEGGKTTINELGGVGGTATGGAVPAPGTGP